MNRRAVCWGATAALAVGVISSAAARPTYLAAFKEHYRTAQGKPTLNAANCSMCHIGMPNQRRWNVYGEAVRTALGAPNVQDRAKIVQALQQAEKGSNPAVNMTFAALINADRQPGQAPAGGGGGATGDMVRGTWTPLFNGVNMDGWTKMNQGNWAVQDGILKYTGGGNGWLRSNLQFTNYAMLVVWRYTEGAQTGQSNDSGIFLKAPMEGNPWPGGPQLNLGPQQNFGSIGGTQGTRPRYDLIKPNDWNTYAVTVENGLATMAINGQTAWDTATGLPAGPGYIGLQAENRPIEFAQIWIMPLQ